MLSDDLLRRKVGRGEMGTEGLNFNPSVPITKVFLSDDNGYLFEWQQFNEWKPQALTP